MGGLRKTQFASEYAHRFRNHYSALLAVSATNEETLKESIADLVGCLQIAVSDPGDLDSGYRAAIKWLKENKEWFLLVDQVDTEEMFEKIEGLVKKLHNGHVVITARLQQTLARPALRPVAG